MLLDLLINSSCSCFGALKTAKRRLCVCNSGTFQHSEHRISSPIDPNKRLSNTQPPRTRISTRSKCNARTFSDSPNLMMEAMEVLNMYFLQTLTCWLYRCGWASFRFLLKENRFIFGKCSSASTMIMIFVIFTCCEDSCRKRDDLHQNVANLQRQILNTDWRHFRLKKSVSTPASCLPQFWAQNLLQNQFLTQSSIRVTTYTKNDVMSAHSEMYFSANKNNNRLLRVARDKI